MTTHSSRTYADLAPGMREAVTHARGARHRGADARGRRRRCSAACAGAASASGPGAPGAAAIALISALLLRQLPGPGSRIVATHCHYAGELHAGDVLDASVEVHAKLADGIVDFACRCTTREGFVLVDGHVHVRPPAQALQYDAIAAPELIARKPDAFARMAQSAAALPAVTCAVVHPCDRDSLLGPLEAAQRGLIVPILVGPLAKIRATAEACGASLDGIKLVDTPHSHAAAATAVAMARAGEVEALMKGSLHTDELMEAVVDAATGLRTDRRISHVFVMDVPTYPRLLYVTDAAVNIAPDLATKADITRNAIGLAHDLGLANPRVAIMSAVETVNPKIQSTLDAAALCKMAERGQITGGVLDGPLAFDNAVSVEAARTKNIDSPVAGRADILVVPDIESGNMVAKQLQYLANAGSAGIVVGARVPIVLTSRADSVRSRLASTVVLKLVAHARRTPGV